MSFDILKIKGKLEIFEEGKLVLTKNNLVVNGGLALVMDRLKDNSTNYLDYIGVGSDNGPVTALDDALGVEILRKQATLKTAADNTFIIETLFASHEAIGSWEEAAIFNSATLGVMFNRINFTYNKTYINTTLRFTITITT